jgi:hypothetical protein
MRNHRPDTGLNAALALYLVVYCAVAGCFGLTLYLLLQPAQNPNVGLAAYTPPPGTVVAYVPANRPQAERSPEPAVTVADRPAVPNAEPETTGAAVKNAEAEPPAAMTPRERPRMQRAAAKNWQQRREDDWNWTRGSRASRYEYGFGRYDYGRSRYAEQPWSGGSRGWW